MVWPPFHLFSIFIPVYLCKNINNKHRVYMKWIITLLLLSTMANAQPVYVSDSSFLYEMELPSKEPFDTAHKWKKAESALVYIASEKDLYDVFGYNVASQHSGFDFTTKHILGQRLCRQCFRHCQHDQGQKECHRNACYYSWVWQVRQNDKALSEMAFTISPGHQYDNDVHPSKFWKDTLISSATKTKWYTTGAGDCHSTFTYKLFADKYYPVLLLKEWNHYGGCRAAGFTEITLNFTIPEGIKHYFKSTTLDK